ncbi:MAG: Crossover junction endodeoxyribonuclease RuvC [Candidatus Gottesmanbacteria bacterium GW2011_GWA1_42_26]|nr:MAG: Crossover junction endodeoxyribonuclease RuvC [Candidatus Gottesmanbacteria bacterium GW2011_GWA1_42_26]
MIIMGIDPGTATTGWGIVSKTKSNSTFISVGTITTASNLSPEVRLEVIFKDLMEQLFFNTNAKTALLVGQARGVVMLATQLRKIPLFSYTPLQVKMAITGYGRADKKQIQEMVKRLLNLKTIPRPDDAADALAVALTHSFTKKFGG